MKFNDVNKTLPDKTGTYSVRYRPAKSSKERVGTAKFLKSKKRFTDVKGASGRTLERQYFRIDTESVDNRPSSQPRVVAWA